LEAGVIGNTVQGSKTSKPTIPVGLVFSLTGSYRTVGEELLNGALLAIEEVNSASLRGSPSQRSGAARRRMLHLVEP
jgi:hypothetical protein